MSTEPVRKNILFATFVAQQGIHILYNMQVKLYIFFKNLQLIHDTFIL